MQWRTSQEGRSRVVAGPLRIGHPVVHALERGVVLVGNARGVGAPACVCDGLNVDRLVGAARGTDERIVVQAAQNLVDRRSVEPAVGQRGAGVGGRQGVGPGGEGRLHEQVKGAVLAGGKVDGLKRRVVHNARLRREEKSSCLRTKAGATTLSSLQAHRFHIIQFRTTKNVEPVRAPCSVPVRR
jgi:hypothetical protein